jgi:hypothetical protein
MLASMHFPSKVITSDFNMYYQALQRQLGVDSSATVKDLRNPALRGLLKAFDSMNVLSPGYEDSGVQIEQWNPYSQRPLAWMGNLGSPRQKNFLAVSEALNRFVLLAHEALHVILLEDFFVGKSAFSNRDHFIDFNLANEGFTFWMTDWVIWPEISASLPKTEFRYSNFTVASPFFSPRAALASVDIKSQSDSLEFYLDSFMGYSTDQSKKLSGKTRKNLLAHNLQQNFRQFFVASLKPLENLYSAFHRNDFLPLFQKKFCQIPNLPRLMDDCGDSKGDEFAYFSRMYRQQLPKISRISNRQLNLIRLRRRLQQRGYYALTIRLSLQHQNVFTPNGIVDSAESATLVKKLIEYENEIVELLNKLARGEPVRAIELLTTQIDGWYGQKIWKPMHLKKYQVARYEYLLDLYNENVQREEFGLVSSEKVPKSRFERASRLIADALKANQISHVAASELFCQLDEVRNLKVGRRQRQTFNRWLTSKKMSPLWGSRLDEIDPRKDQFSDILFCYQ